ncbi:MAG: potassium channel family protein [Croceibacterium sp.]
MRGAVDGQQVISATFDEQLAIGAGMIALCVLIHGIGLFTLRRTLLGHDPVSRFAHIKPLSLRGTGFTLLVVLTIILIHFVEIWLFAFLYDLLRALPTFQDALYFSTISYSTIGYNDASIAENWRMIAALEGMLGVILLGWSTAFLVRVLGALEAEGGDARSAEPPDGA